MGKKKVHHEEHVDETWLIPYSDMLTLLLALFIVMFAMSQVDNQKLQKASQSFNAVFSSGSGMLQSDGSNVIEAVQAHGNGSATTNNVTEQDKMNAIKQKLDKEITEKGYEGKVKVVINKEGLEISIQDVVLFNSGDAQIVNQVYPLLTQISNMLKSLDNSVRITGHTDNNPIHNEKFRSNWDLSAMRAINVMNYISNVGGISPKRLSIQAYGEYMPKFDNSTESGRAKNRRVEISIIRKYPLNTKENTKTDKKN